MIAPKFIRFRTGIININLIVDIDYCEEKNRTSICYNVGNRGVWGYYPGNHRDELWELIKLAKQVDGSLVTSNTFNEGVQLDTVDTKECPNDKRIPIGRLDDGTPIYKA